MNNKRIQEIALACGFSLKDQGGGERDLNPYVYDFARAIVQEGKPKNSHREYISDFLKDAAACQPIQTPGFLVSIYANESCVENPRLRWDFYDGVKASRFEVEIPDTREDLNKALNHGKGCMKSASYRALNPDFDKKIT